MDDSIFQEKAEIILQSMVDAIEMADEEGEIDIDFIDGVANIILPDEQEYVINIHSPSQQIWVSSPFSGASKFSYDEDEDEWMPENGRNFRDFISIEFSHNLNLDVEF
jgi:frataxin